MSLNVYQRIWTPFDQCPCFEPCITSVIDSYLVCRQQLSTTHRHWLLAWGLHTNYKEAFYDAARHADLSRVQLLYQHESITTSDVDKAVSFAIMGGNIETVKYLIQVSLQFALKRDKAFDLAVQHGHLHLVEYFFNLGVRINKKSNIKALSKAAANGHLHVIQYLIHMGVHLKQHANESIRHACENGHLQVVEYLINLNLDISYKYHDFLKTASRYGRLNVVQYLICNQSVNVSQDNDKSIRVAAVNGHLDVVQYLAGQGADIRQCCVEDGQFIAEGGFLNVLKYLHDKEVFNHVDFSSFAVPAVEGGHLHVLQYLVHHGADVTFQNNKVMAHAIYNGQLHIVKYLVSLGVDVTSMDDNYPVYTAIEIGHLDMLKYFFSLGCGTKPGDRLYIHIAIQNAIYYDHIHIVKYLLLLNFDNQEIDIPYLLEFAYHYSNISIYHYLQTIDAS